MLTIPCPVCKGSKRYKFENIHGRISTGICTACRGTGKMDITPAALQRRERESEQVDKRKEYVSKFKLADEEIRIIAEMGTIRSTMDRLAEKGFNRTRKSIAQVRFLLRKGDMRCSGVDVSEA